MASNQIIAVLLAGFALSALANPCDPVVPPQPTEEPCTPVKQGLNAAEITGIAVGSVAGAAAIAGGIAGGVIANRPEYNDPCPFGYGTNCPVGGQIDAAAKAQVVEILEAILSKLSSPEDQVVQLPVDMSKDTEEAIKALLAKLQGTQQAAEGTTLEHKLGEYFGADGDHSVDPEHNQPLARILEGILAILAPPTPPPTPVQPVVIGVLVPGGSRLYKTDDKPTVAQTDMAAKVGSPSVLMGVSAFVFFGFAFLAISGLIYARSNMNRRSTRAITVQDPFVQDLEEDIE